MLKFSFRRDRADKHFKHIAPGLIPAASIAPKPAVPRTPPPRSPNPSPERPRSALAAAILSSSLTGQTWALPPARPRSLSDSNRSQSFTSELNTGAALYNRDRWSSADHSEEELQGRRRQEEEEEEEEEEQEHEEEHVYQTLNRQERCSIAEPVDAQSVKTKGGEVQSGPDRFSPDRPGPTRPGSTQCDPKPPSPGRSVRACSRRAPSPAADPPAHPLDPRRSGQRAAEPGDLYSEVRREKSSRMGDERRQLEERLQRLEREVGHGHRKSPPGGRAELHSLRQQAQELVDENDALKTTVHRLSVELRLYQSRFRPLSKQESSKLSGLPKTGSPPPGLLDTKSLSPLLLAYEDRMSESDALLKTSEEEVKRLRLRMEEVIKEKENLRVELSKSSSVSQKDCQELQQQAVLVLQENQALQDQLEAQQVKTKAAHSRHQAEETKLSKRLMLLEAENQRLQEELEESRAEGRRHAKDAEALRFRLKDAVTWDEHCSITAKLRRELEEQEQRIRREVEELQLTVSALQEENRRLSRDKTNLSLSVRTAESELQLCTQANRRAEARMNTLRRQKEECELKEEKTRRYLSSVLSVAELISSERDHILHAASVLQQDKQRFIGRIFKGTVRLGKLQEEVTVYRKQASSRLAALEEAAEGRTASQRREIIHLQRLLGERREAEEKLLQSKREVEEELELLWQAATRHSQQTKDVDPDPELRGWNRCDPDSPDRMVPASSSLQTQSLDYYCFNLLQSAPH